MSQTDVTLDDKLAAIIAGITGQKFLRSRCERTETKKFECFLRKNSTNSLPYSFSAQYTPFTMYSMYLSISSIELFQLGNSEEIYFELA